MTDTITVAGVIATSVKDITTGEGLRIASFRLASNARRYDRKTDTWVDLETNWFTVTAFRRLAEHVAASFEKGQRVLVHGRLRVRAWESGDRSGTTVEIEADSAGHDLRWGTSEFTRDAAESAKALASSPEAQPPSASAQGSDDAAAPGEAPSSGAANASEQIAPPVPSGGWAR